MRYLNKNSFLTPQEVATVLKLSTLTIYKYIKQGKLEAITFGGHYRISVQSLETFISHHKVPTQLQGVRP